MGIKSIKILPHYILGFIFFLNFNAFAQVAIDQPINRAVYQRNSSNLAAVVINGSYSSPIVSSVQARFVYPNTNTPIPGFDWQIIDQFPSKGKFYGVLNNVYGGWHTLQVRTVKSGTVLESSQVDRVGVGDVFLIAGQSNAAGWNSSGFLGSTDERVVTHSQLQGCNTVTPLFPSMTQLTSNVNVGATGENAWVYGKLGQDLVNQNGVPIAFFNAAAVGSSVENWLQSSFGTATIHPFTGQQYCTGFNNPVGTPYRFVDASLNFYNSLFGIKAILWHQGESDQFLNTTAADYQSRLTSFINKTRTDFGATIPWVVSRASYYNGNVSANVINGQNNVISSSGLSQVYAGPSSDNIVGQGFRDDDIHLNDQGLFNLATGWGNSLNSTFINNATPISPTQIPDLSISINGSNVTLTAPSGYSSYKWVQGNNFTNGGFSTSPTFTSSTGTFRCFMTQGNRITMSQAVNIDQVLSQTNNDVSCITFAYLSDLKPASQNNGFGPIEYDKSNGGSNDGDGNTLTLNGITYSKGIGAHANSEITYILPNNKFFNLSAIIGVDDEVGNAGSLKFQVLSDNSILYESPTMTGASSNITLNVNITGVTLLKLKILAEGTNANGHGDWADVKLECNPPDIIPPTPPTNLALTGILSKCLSFSWTAATDNIAVTGYNIFQNGIFQTTVAGSQLSYTLSNLSQNTSYTIGVQARDAIGNTSTIVNSSAQTAVLSMEYSNNDFCVNEDSSPSFTPSGGVFTLFSGPTPYNLNSSTGVFNSSVENGIFTVKYTIAAGNPTCEASINNVIRTNAKPLPPTLSGGTSPVNTGTSLSFISSTCANGYIWQNSSTLSTLNITLPDTTSVFVRCRRNGCYSNSSNVVVVNVIPDCPNTFNLTSPNANLANTVNPLNFQANNSIQATNIISPVSNINYKAGAKIELNPGFTVNPGTVFSATIGGCP